MSILTIRGLEFRLSNVAAHSATGFRSLERQGVITPIKGVFYCLQKSTGLFRVSYMVAHGGQPKGWPEPCPGTANLLCAAAKQFAVVGGGLSLRQGKSL